MLTYKYLNDDGKDRGCRVSELVDDNQIQENLFGVVIRCGQDQPDEYGKLADKK